MQRDLRGATVARTDKADLRVGEELADFIDHEVLPGSGIGPGRFWQGFSDLVHGFGEEQRALLGKREELQGKIDRWYLDRRPNPANAEETRMFLEGIGYLLPDGPDFQIETGNIDEEISSVAGPQLVVPASNARYALNAANARWGSLYDALYGTDALGRARNGSYDHAHGARVIRWAREFLDRAVPLDGASHIDVDSYVHSDGRLLARIAGRGYELKDRDQYCGHQGDRSNPDAIILKNNGLHILVRIDANHPVGSSDKAGVSDIVLESALTTIIDCEDSVAAVNAAEKTLVYRNWLGLMKGDLEASFHKAGKQIHRRLEDDTPYVTAGGLSATLRRRSLLLVRNVGLLMTSPAILDRNGFEVHESLMDGMCTTLIARHDLNKADESGNSRYGSVYVVVPKLHGPQEVAYVDRVFSEIEKVLDVPHNTVKIGIMDEERRTSVNLKSCIRAARARVAFINTGFLDRTGDEIHTAMEAGTFLRKNDIRSQPWIAAYEDRNVDIGLACGFSGKAQIGKGMWAAADLMRDMLEQKSGHPRAGANCAWVPSPTAATLHATHYHEVDVFARQDEIAALGSRGKLGDLLTVPLAGGVNWSRREIQDEIDNNAQGILGYVVRWVDHGVGCSKVPDINDVALMEDRATCRISSQMLANWMHHGVVSAEQVMVALRRMAAKVDAQNVDDPKYKPMAPDYDGPAFMAARDLVFGGTKAPSGYTEPALHARRLQALEAAGNERIDRG